MKLVETVVANILKILDSGRDTTAISVLVTQKHQKSQINKSLFSSVNSTGSACDSKP